VREATRDPARDEASFKDPATALSLNQYLKAVTAEQLQAQATPKQATPFSSMICNPKIYLWQAYFKALLFSGDRLGYLGQAQTPEILRFPDNDGLLFNHVWEKLCVMVQQTFLPYVAIKIPNIVPY